MNEFRKDLIPSATVVVVREMTSSGSTYLEVLLLKRNAALKVGGGMWVFPGGKLTESELNLSRNEGARQAAVRECEEECGLHLDPTAIHYFSRWITPKHIGKRFDTDFFIATVAPEEPVEIDNSEIVDSMWVKPKDAIKAMHSGELAIGPPTMVSLIDVEQHTASNSLMTHYENVSEPRLFEPLGFELPNDCDPVTGAKILAESDGNKNAGFLMLYHGDAGYENAEPDNTSFKHRTIFDSHGVRYFRDNQQLI